MVLGLGGYEIINVVTGPRGRGITAKGQPAEVLFDKAYCSKRFAEFWGEMNRLPFETQEQLIKHFLEEANKSNG